MVDYRRLRLSNLTSKEFRHVFLLLAWVVIGIVFYTLETIPRPYFHPMWCPLDDLIPFCEWFIIPYLFWFVYLIGMHIYLALVDVPAFKRFMYFIILIHAVTLVVYALYPNCQELRVVDFPRDNILSRMVADFYAFDTNTNVCPSLHCLSSMAVIFAAWDTPRLKRGVWRAAFTVTGLVIAVSTVFVKQHSILDVFWGWGLAAVAYVAVYVAPKWFRRKGEAACSEQTTT